jgi:predicted MPP superfamily phosphohydrolase
VLGNHDHWASGSPVGASMKQIIADGGVRELDNAVAPIERGGVRLWLCGVDDLWVGRADLNRVTQHLREKSRPDEVAILMAHEPDFADEVVREGRFALQLSGHSHGGQVALPLLGPPILPKFGRKYHTGLYRVRHEQSALWQFTTRGVGVAGPRVRFNCPPEIALLTLRSA